MRRSGITLTELLVILTALIPSLFIVIYFDCFGLGWIGFLVGLPLTFFASFLAIWAAIAGFVFVEGLFTGIPFLPTSDRCGAKSGWLMGFGDYELVMLEDNMGWKCRCGRTFVRDRKRRRVMEVQRDGSVVPFRVWKPFHGWQIDAE